MNSRYYLEVREFDDSTECFEIFRKHGTEKNPERDQLLMRFDDKYDAINELRRLDGLGPLESGQRKKLSKFHTAEQTEFTLLT